MYDNKVHIIIFLVGHKNFEKKTHSEFDGLKFQPIFELFCLKNDHKHTEF